MDGTETQSKHGIKAFFGVFMSIYASKEDEMK